MQFRGDDNSVKILTAEIRQAEFRPFGVLGGIPPFWSGQSVGPPPAKERQVKKVNDKMVDRVREADFKLEQVCGWKLGPQIFIRILFGTE